MTLKFDPQDEKLVFGSNKEKCKSTVKIKNESHFVQAQKVQSTHPLYYKVQPNTGVVQAGGAISLTFEYEPKDPEGTHKFKIQQAIYHDAPTDDQSISKFFKNVGGFNHKKYQATFAGSHFEDFTIGGNNHYKSIVNDDVLRNDQFSTQVIKENSNLRKQVNLQEGIIAEHKMRKPNSFIVSLIVFLFQISLFLTAVYLGVWIKENEHDKTIMQQANQAYEFSENIIKDIETTSFEIIKQIENIFV